ncbi:MAG: hypothetical protein JJE51_06800 [Thermoanaerobaculia bacterium]|nr:hypothetical protein [Thermoanaerobaculia bacterium]
MPVRRAAIAVSLLFCVAVGANAADEFAGVWLGPLISKVPCGSETGTATFIISVSMSLTQTGSTVSGNGTFARQIIDFAQCIPTGGIDTQPFSVSGTANGSSLTVPLRIQSADGTIAMNVAGSSMSMSLSFPGSPFTADGTLSRAGGGGLTGTYEGTYTSTLSPCNGKLPLFTYTGNLTLTLIQAGDSITGAETTFGDKRDNLDSNGTCTIKDVGSTTNTVSGRVTGSILTLTFESNRSNTFTANVSGNTISATVAGEFAGEVTTFTVTRTSTTPPVPQLIRFSATPSSVAAGRYATLSWAVANVATVTIDNGVGSQPASGSITVSPSRSTTYTLTATGAGGSVTATTTVTVTGVGPRVVAATLPAGMLLATGETGATDSFTVANVGTDAANVSLAKSGNFFSISPESFVLQPRASQLIAITATAQPAVTDNGTITVNGDGVVTGGITVRVRLLVASPPAGTVRLAPSTARIDVAAPAGQSPSGVAPFTNSGSAPMTGIAVSDVPWIVPENGPITINPGETKNVTFSIEPSRRPDADSLFGGATGSMSLRFLGRSTATNAVTNAVTPNSTVSVSIVHVVKPGTSSGSPPPLEANELALLIPSHGSTEGIQADLYLSNRAASPLSNLKLFLSQSLQIASLPSLGANRSVSLPSVSTSIFGVDAGGSLMLRGSEGTAGTLSVAAVRIVNPTGSAAYTSSIPVFRSSGGVGPGGTIVLSGVERSANARTTVVVQELSGNPGSVSLQAYDENGAALGASGSIALGAFYSQTDNALAVVEGSRSIIITNTGTGGGRINAYARVRSNSTADTWIITDTSLEADSDSMIMPTISTALTPGQTDIFVTNRSASTVSATLNAFHESTRRRAVRSNAAGAAHSDALQQWTIQPRETKRATVTPTSGYVQLTGPAGALSVSARVTLTSTGESFGSALPPLPAASAQSLGELKRFGGVGDASAATVAAGTTATYRSSLIVIETAGESATLRVTLSFSLPAGLALTSQAVVSKELILAPNQIRVVRDLARSIIGPQRDSFADLRDMQVDVEVVGGGGTVLSYIESTDNGTGDVVIRPE